MTILEQIQALKPIELGIRFGVVYGIMLLRYTLIAGGAFALFWVWKRRDWLHLRIQERFPTPRHYRREIAYSLSTFAVFALVGIGIHLARQAGWTQIYLKVSRYGWGYLAFSTVALILLHDTYFYWTHRFMHWKPVFKHVHRVHHQSINPSPLASFSFHPLEAVIEAGIVPLAIVLFPLHPLAILIFLIYMTAMNALGHLGYELFPSGWTTHPLSRWHNSSTHHNQHHARVHCNYGLYFNWWDRLMGTNHERYTEHFEEVKARAHQHAPGSPAENGRRDAMVQT